MTLPIIFLQMPHEKKNKTFILPPLTALLGHRVQNFFVALILKIFLQTLVNYFFLEFCDPPTNKMKSSLMGCWVSK